MKYSVHPSHAFEPIAKRRLTLPLAYLQAGPSFFIEKSKRRMIAEDIRMALALVK